MAGFRNVIEARDIVLEVSEDTTITGLVFTREGETHGQG